MRLPPGESYYEVLGVPRTATQEQIRFSYRALAAHYHPDKHQGNPLQELAAEKLARVNEAYDVLSDPERRSGYDTQLGAPAAGAWWRGTGGSKARLPRPAVVVGVVLALLLLRPLLVLVSRLFAALSGTPFGLVVFVGLVAGGLWWWRRRRGAGGPPSS